ncbi:hypothetical protein PAXRUDRAFT_22063 [Paxillus rubicundulus Ve08.2h10]|uniref:Uncharacterized protein n=1 Tax=Paxillus rubicundulus Ve08.2h10 TaxID=930991 RepID=A0A0D0CNQ0_9AGAM|nr:hypothetical protein PAXRUDRAFT_22063 [Paxillus rubicundulus Ve08.2h10]
MSDHHTCTANEPSQEPLAHPDLNDPPVLPPDDEVALTPSTDKGKGCTQIDSDLDGMDVDCGYYGDDNEGMALDEGDLGGSRLAGKKRQEPEKLTSPSPPHSAFVHPNKAPTPNTDNRSAFRLPTPTATTRGRSPHLSAGSGHHSTSVSSSSTGCSTRAPISSSGTSVTSSTRMTSQSGVSSTKRAKVGAQHHIQSVLEEADNMRQDKLVALELKNDRLRIKLDHERHRSEQSFAHEERGSEQANAAIVHQREMEKMKQEVELKNAESDTYERKKEMLMLELEVLKFHQGASGSGL